MKKVVVLVVLIFLFASGCYSELDLYKAEETSYSSGYSDGLQRGAEEGYESGYNAGYDEGFQMAVNIILDTMDPEYRAKWWDENIETITRHNIEF